jgi:glycosyltransferase involved in cell wall biosynthesis
MKVAYIAASVIPSWTANSVQVMKVCQALTQNGENVILFVPGSTITGWNEMRSHYGVTTEFPIRWIKSRQGFKKLDFVFSSLRIAKKEKMDLVYTRLLWAAVLGLRQGFPVILEIHDRPVGRMGPWLLRRFVSSKGEKHVAIITQALKNILEKEYDIRFDPNEVVIAPDGVDLERYTEKVSSNAARTQLGLKDCFTAVYSGGFYEGRGLESLVELAKAFPTVQFLWIGGKSDVVSSWKKKIKDVGIDNIQLTGFVPNEFLPLYQISADVLLMPYGKIVAGSSGGNIAEVSSPMKMFEYMASGRVILTSDIPVLREVLNDSNAAFYAPEDIKELTAVFSRLMNNDKLRNKLASQALKDVAQYSWQERMKKIMPTKGRKL